MPNTTINDVLNSPVRCSASGCLQVDIVNTAHLFKIRVKLFYYVSLKSGCTCKVKWWRTLYTSVANWPHKTSLCIRLANTLVMQRNILELPYLSKCWSTLNSCVCSYVTIHIMMTVAKKHTLKEVLRYTIEISTCFPNKTCF